MQSTWTAWTGAWERTLAAVEAKGGEILERQIDPPASAAEVAAVEQELGRPLPDAFRRVLLECSRAVCLEWELPDDVQCDELSSIGRGELAWSLPFLPELEEFRREGEGDLAEGIASRALWADGLAFSIDMQSKDLLAFDGRSGREGAVIVLDAWGSDDVDGNEIVARDFIDYIDRITALGFVDPVSSILPMFMSVPGEGIDLACEASVRWRTWLGLA